MKKLYVIIGLLVALGTILYLGKATENPPRDLRGDPPETPPAVIPGKIDQIRIVRNRWENGAYREETATLRKLPDQGWQMTTPVVYPVNNALAHEMVAALGAMRLVPVRPPTPADDRALQLDDTLGIDVTAYSESRVMAHLIIGLSQNNTTYVRQAYQRAVYRTPGLYRKVFDRSPNQLRSRVITDLDSGSVTRVSYRRGRERFTMAKRATSGAARFEPVGIEVENFDSDRALLKAEALTTLRARNFCDHSVSDSDLGEGEDARYVTIEATSHGTPVTIDLMYGKGDPKTGLHYLTTSASPQVFLVSRHLKALFEAVPEDFRRTDEQVEQQRLWKQKAEAHEREHERRRRAYTGETLK